MIASYLGYTRDYDRKNYGNTFIYLRDLYRLYEVDHSEPGCGIKLYSKLKNGMQITLKDINRKNSKEAIYTFDGRSFISPKRKPVLGYTYDQNYIITKLNGKTLNEDLKVQKYIKIINKMVWVEKEFTKYFKKNKMSIDLISSYLNGVGNKMLSYTTGFREEMFNDKFEFKIERVEGSYLFYSINGEEIKTNVRKYMKHKLMPGEKKVKILQ